MFGSRKRMLNTLGNPPGTPVFTGETGGPVSITVTNYDGDYLQSREDLTPDEAVDTIDRDNTTWIDIRSLGEVEIITRLSSRFGFHPIIEESLANGQQRTRLEEFDRYLYFMLHDCRFDEATGTIDNTPVSLLLADGVVISATGSDRRCFSGLYRRLETGKGRLRTNGPDYLLYAIIDSIVDGYFLTLNGIGEYLDILEQETITAPEPVSAQRINSLKTELFSLRRTITPLREIINTLRREETPFLTDETRVFIRDLYEHTILIIESLDLYRERLSGLFDIYLSSISNRMNRVMQVLTLIATIFIPLTFLAGVYGMNFKHMPELDKAWAYPAFWGIIVVTAVGMVIFFKRKRWL